MTKIRQSQSYEACLCWGFLLPAPAPGAFRWWCLGPTGWYQWAELVDTLLNLPRMSPNWKLAYIILVWLLPLLFSWHQSVCSVCSWMLCPWGSLGTYQHLSTLLLPSSFLCCLVYKWLIFKCSSLKCVSINWGLEICFMLMKDHWEAPKHLRASQVKDRYT